MKRLLFAAIAGVALASAGPPEEEEGQAREARSGYPPCSARVTDECIQLYERGVASPENLAENRGPHRRTTAAAGGYPPCTATRKDECRQQRRLARRIRMAGERG